VLYGLLLRNDAAMRLQAIKQDAIFHQYAQKLRLNGNFLGRFQLIKSAATAWSHKIRAGRVVLIGHGQVAPGVWWKGTGDYGVGGDQAGN